SLHDALPICSFSDRATGQSIKCAAAGFDVAGIWHWTGQRVAQGWPRLLYGRSSDLADFGTDFRRLGKAGFEICDDLGGDAAPGTIVDGVFQHLCLSRDENIEQLARFLWRSFSIIRSPD